LRNTSIFIILRLLRSITLESKINSLFLLILSIICGILEALIIVFAVPIINIVTFQNNVIPDSNIYYKFLDFFKLTYSNFNLINSFIIIVLLNLFIRIINLKILKRLSSKIASELASKAYKNVINQNYKFFDEINIKELISSFAYDFNKTEQAIDAFFVLNSSYFVSFILLLGISFISKLPGLIGVFLILFFYILISNLNKKKLINNSKEFVSKHTNQTRLATEDMRSIKDIILNKSYNYHVKKFKNLDFNKRRITASNAFINTYPKYIVESIILLFLAISALNISIIGLSSTNNVSFIGSLGLACLRIIPILQLIYSSWSRIEGNRESIIKVSEFVKLKFDSLGVIKPLKWQKQIILKFKKFKYKSQNKVLFNNKEFLIEKGDRTVILGKSGSGKTTIVNFLMGLRFDKNVSLFVDNLEIKESTEPQIIHNWHSSIGHISQNGIIVSDTIAKNIAFGQENKNIDFERIQICAKKAQIYDFILNFKFGFDTLLIEEGKNLSHGQRQRILLARALYSGTSLLVVDEGTSALDKTTENQIMKSLSKVDEDITIICITHNRNLVKYFSKVIDLDKS